MEADHPTYKWVALSNTTLGMLLATINSSIVLISLPAIFRGIHLDPLEPGNVSYLLWMIMGFLVVSAVLVARASGARLVVFRPGTLWVRSLAGSFSLIANFYAFTRLPVGDVLTLTNTYPIWILVFTWLAAREGPGRAELLGVASGLIGVALIERPHAGGEGASAPVSELSSCNSRGGIGRRASGPSGPWSIGRRTITPVRKAPQAPFATRRPAPPPPPARPRASSAATSANTGSCSRSSSS